MRQTATRETRTAGDPHCLVARATLCLADDGLDPDAVSVLLGLAPSDAYRRGAPGRGPGGSPGVTGVWLLGTDPGGPPPALDAHLRALLEIVEPAADALRSLVAEVERAEVFCTWRTAAAGGAGPVIPAVTLARVARLELSLGFDFFLDRAGAAA